MKAVMALETMHCIACIRVLAEHHKTHHAIITGGNKCCHGVRGSVSVQPQLMSLPNQLLLQLQESGFPGLLHLADAHEARFPALVPSPNTLYVRSCCLQAGVLLQPLACDVAPAKLQDELCELCLWDSSGRRFDTQLRFPALMAAPDTLNVRSCCLEQSAHELRLDAYSSNSRAYR